MNDMNNMNNNGSMGTMDTMDNKESMKNNDSMGNMDTQKSNTATATITPASHTQIDDKAIRKMAGEAVMSVDGVLGIGGGIVNMFKKDDDVSTGVSVDLSDDNKKAKVNAKIITEYGKNIPEIVEKITSTVAEALHGMAGITTEEVNVEVADSLTREQYKEKFASNQQNQ